MKIIINDNQLIKIIKENLELKWNKDREYDYQNGFCDKFAKYIRNIFKKRYPEKNIKFLLIFADIIYDFDDGILEDTILTHVYLKIGDMYLDSNGLSTYNEVIKRGEKDAIKIKEYNDISDEYRIDIRYREYNEIPKKYNRVCDINRVKNDIKIFLSHPDVIEILKGLE